MQYVFVEDGVITSYFCGPTLPEGAIQVADNFQGRVGMKIAAIEDDMATVKPLSKQVKEGILEIPDGYKINDKDNELIRMTEEELDEAYPKDTYALPYTEQQMQIRKSFDRYGNFKLDIPEGYIKMSSDQPTQFHTALADGTWKLNEVKLAEDVRRERDNKISKTDYLLSNDYPITTASLENVKTYRQKLRDIPNQEGFPATVVWPDEPVIEKTAVVTE